MHRSSASSSLRAFVALVVTLLQLVGALHFALVPHGYSAALGGVVHTHAKAAAPQLLPAIAREARTQSLSTASLSCIAERCPVADAPQSSAPRIELLAAGLVAFGEVRLIGERCTHEAGSERVLLSAPKTSPPV